MNYLTTEIPNPISSGHQDRRQVYSIFSIFNINQRGLNIQNQSKVKGDIHPRVFDPEVSCFNAMATLWLSLVNVESSLRWSVVDVESPLRFSVVNVETPIRWSAVESPVRPSGALVDISLWMSTGKVESVLSDGVLGFGPWSDVSWISSSWGLNKNEILIS